MKVEEVPTALLTNTGLLETMEVLDERFFI